MRLLAEDTTSGGVYDLTDAAHNIQFTSPFNNGASTLTFDYYGDLRLPNGSVIDFTYDRKMFQGILRKWETNARGNVSVTASDQIRNLKDKDTRIRNNMSLSQFIWAVAAERELRVGSIEKTELVLAKKIFDDKPDIDSIYESIGDSLFANQYWYAFYDDPGKGLTLRDIARMRLNLVLGDSSLAYGYTYAKSIDEETYNVIKLARDTKSSGKRELVIETDDANIKRWGNMQYFEKVNENLNDAQMQSYADLLMKYYNRETQSFSLSAIGDSRVIGGSGIKVEIAAEKISDWGIVTKATHSLSKDNHTMELDIRLSSDYIVSIGG